MNRLSVLLITMLALMLSSCAQPAGDPPLKGATMGGPFTLTAARLGTTGEVTSEDSYGSGPIQREMTSFRGEVRSGNSGGTGGDASRVIEPKLDGDLVYFNWAQYIDPKLIKGFEKEYGVTVRESNFDSMSGMMAKLRSGNRYDVIFPTAEFADKLIKEDQLLEIPSEDCCGFGGTFAVKYPAISGAIASAGCVLEIAISVTASGERRASFVAFAILSWTAASRSGGDDPVMRAAIGRRMRRRQPLPRLWMMTDERQGDALWEALDRLPALLHRGQVPPLALAAHHPEPPAVRVERHAPPHRATLREPAPREGLVMYAGGGEAETPAGRAVRRRPPVPARSARRSGPVGTLRRQDLVPTWMRVARSTSPRSSDAG